MWFKNRRAKWRKQKRENAMKKCDKSSKAPPHSIPSSSPSSHSFHGFSSTSSSSSSSSTSSLSSALKPHPHRHHGNHLASPSHALKVDTDRDVCLLRICIWKAFSNTFFLCISIFCILKIFWKNLYLHLYFIEKTAILTLYVPLRSYFPPEEKIIFSISRHEIFHWSF